MKIDEHFYQLPLYSFVCIGIYLYIHSYSECINHGLWCFFCTRLMGTDIVSPVIVFYPSAERHRHRNVPVITLVLVIIETPYAKHCRGVVPPKRLWLNYATKSLCNLIIFFSVFTYNYIWLNIIPPQEIIKSMICPSSFPEIVAIYLFHRFHKCCGLQVNGIYI